MSAAGFTIDALRPDDWPEVRSIYQEGIDTGQATFETQAPSWESWDAAHLSIARLVARESQSVLGWAALSPVSRRECYRGVAEVSVYVRLSQRGRGIGLALLGAVIAESERQGIWTLFGSTFPENEASLRLQERCGFRIIGRRERIAQLRGVWRDTVLTERRSKTVGAG
jgi:phosphinothricin acetyltransferase